MIHSNKQDQEEHSWAEDGDLSSLFTNTSYVRSRVRIHCHDEDENELPAIHHFPQQKHLTVELYCSPAASTDYDLTGQVVWPVSMLLAHHLASKRGKALISGKSLVELGAGVGLAGLIASDFATKVLLSDGNDSVVNLLKKNASAYISSGHVTKPGNERLQHSVQENSCISVQKFVWGDRTELLKILHDFGSVDVVIAADVVQWPAVVEPLLHTVKALLWESVDEKPMFLLGLVQRAQSTSQEFFDLAKRLGFAWEKVDYAKFLPGGVLPDSCKEHGGRITEIFEIRLIDRSDPPILLDESADDDCDSTLGKNYQHSALPC